MCQEIFHSRRISIPRALRPRWFGGVPSLHSNLQSSIHVVKPYQFLDDFNSTRGLPPRFTVVHDHDINLLLRPRLVRVGPTLTPAVWVNQLTPKVRVICRDELEQNHDLAINKLPQLLGPLDRRLDDVPPRGHDAAHQRLAANRVDYLLRCGSLKCPGRIQHVLEVQQHPHLDEHHAGGRAQLELQEPGRLEDVGAPDVEVRLGRGVKVVPAVVVVVHLLPPALGGPPPEEVVARLVPAQAEVQRGHDVAQAQVVPLAAQAEHVREVVQGRPHGVGVPEVPENLVHDGVAGFQVVARHRNAPEVAGVHLEEVGAGDGGDALVPGAQLVLLAAQVREGLPDVCARVLVAVAVAGLVLAAAVVDRLAAAAALQAGSHVANLTLAWPEGQSRVRSHQEGVFNCEPKRLLDLAEPVDIDCGFSGLLTLIEPTTEHECL